MYIKKEQIHVRVTQKEKTIIQAKAKRCGLSMSGFLVSCALKSRVDGYGEVKKEIEDQKKLEPIKGQTSVYDFDFDDDDDFFKNF